MNGRGKSFSVRRHAGNSSRAYQVSSTIGKLIGSPIHGLEAVAI